MAEPLRPKAVITGHTQADYDALAAMVAAKKLYPDAVLIAPTMLERRGSHIFSDSIAYLFDLKSPKNCDFSEVELLVVVDTHQASRIPHVADALTNPGLVVHVYDHHPDSDDDLPAAFSVIKPYGSTAALITEIIREKDLPVEPDEATMLGLGIYEDTGAFTFTSTTEQDMLAAAFLLGKGMDLSTIAELIGNDLTREQIHYLDVLLKHAVTHTFHGIPVTVTEIVLDKFEGDFASLAHRLMDMENLKVLFVLAAMDDRVHLIARSKVPEVDVGQICASFGGGGHAFAASAGIKDKPLAEIRASLLALLVAGITPQMTVGRHMTAPAVSIEAHHSLEEAEEIMSRYGLKAAPIVETGGRRCVGMLELQTASRAVAHKLGDRPLSDYMHRQVRTLEPDAGLYSAVEIILKDRQRLIPIEEHGEVVGVLTRSDIMRLLIDDSLHIPEGTPLDREHRELNVVSLLQAQLPAPLVEALREAGRLGDELHCSVYAVGGFVRDLLMKRPNLDIDLSVEGDGIAFAEALAERLKGRVRSHKKFKTAVVFYTDSEGVAQHLDVATARLEYYEYPAALPTVELSSIKMDLYRRDFTINALAVQLNERRFGTLIDPFEGRRDLKERTISVLHSLSFIEDPTRILRAVRFERRFEFQINRQTERLIKNALSLKMIDRLSGVRLFNELTHVFDEKEAPACIRRLEGWGIWKAVHPVMQLNPGKDILVAGLEEVLAWYRLLYKTPAPRGWVLYMLGLTAGAKYPDVAAALDRLGLIERAKTDFLSLRENTRRAGNNLINAHNKGDTRMSTLHDLLYPLEIEGLLYLMARYGQEHNIGKDVSLFLTRLRDEKVEITGEDLATLGEAPGPLFGLALKETLRAKLDGKVKTKEEELAYASKVIVEAKEGDKACLSIPEVLAGRL